MTDDELRLLVAQEREIQELRKLQLHRDGKIYDSILGEWTIAVRDPGVTLNTTNTTVAHA